MHNRFSEVKSWSTIRLIQSFYDIEMLHAISIDNNNDKNEHFVIDIEQILEQ